MTIPSNIDDATTLRFRQNDREGQTALRYTDSEMKEGEIGSRQFVTLVDVIAEGEIAGFPSAIDAGLTQGTNDYNICALKDVFLNNTQVMKQSAPSTGSDDSDFNFGTSTANRPAFIPRFGTSDQTRIQGLLETERDRPVGVTVTVANPQTVTITDTSTEGIRVTLGFPRLQKIEDDGSISGVNVLYGIQVKNQAGTVIKGVLAGGTPYWVLSEASRAIYGGASGQVSGKSTSPYFKDHIIFIPDDTADSDFPLTVTVTRTSADSTSDRIIDAFELTSITELIFDPSNFPNTALAALRFDAEIFRSIPRRTFRVRGRLVKIPHNSTVRSDGSLSFSGSFNGTLKATKEYCNDPAWVLYDLITESRSGFGDFISEDEVDKYAFYNASEYNSTLIDNGQGGTGPRFSCNIVIQRSHEGYTILNKVASIMRASLFFEDGKITLAQDRPTTSSYFFSYANVNEDGFVYTGASQKTKDTVINVKYFQNQTRTHEYETVEDTAANQAKYGVVVKNIEAIGCSDQAQARRMGLWHLYTQNNETETVSFSTTADAGSLIRPSQIITIQDPVRSGLRRSGRIAAATTTEITVDNTKDLPTEAASGDQLSVILTDGTLETQTISTISGSVITVSSAYASAPQVNSVWLLVRTTVETEDFRVLSVTEDNNLFTITAMFHNSDKYAFVEDGAAITTPVIKNLIELKDSPSDLTAEELIVVLGDRAVSKIFLSWQPVAGVSQYSVKHKFNDGSFQTTIVQSPVFEIFDSELGTYEFEVFSYNAFFEPSIEPTPLTFIAEGKTAVPADVQNVRIEPLSDEFVRLRFDKSTDVDVLHGGNVVIRSSNLTSGVTFTNAVDVLPALSGNVNETIVPNIVNGTYVLKFQDDGGRLSSGDASVVMLQTQPDVFPKLTVLEDREDSDSPPFAGAKVDCFFSDDVNGLVLGSLELLDGVTDFDAIADFDFLGAVDITGGHYDFANTLDLGGKQPLHLRRHIVSQGYYPNDLIDKRTANIDTWTDFDAATAFDVGAKLLVATTDSDPDTSTAGTYTINNGSGSAGTIITITKSSHGYSVGSFVTVDFTSGTGVDGDYQISAVTTNNFTLTSATSLSTSGNCNFSAEFSQYNPFVNGSYIARGFKFRCEMDTNDPAQSIEIDQLGYTAELNSRTETSLGNAGATNGLIASGTSSKTVTFTNSFFTGSTGTGVADNTVLPSVGITIENGQSGDFFALSSISSTGFVIDVKNGSSFVNRNFKYAATGFGRGS
ncbi:phage tail protein [uncultured Mediterranean phage uvMED]|nr:phage tail protein [uncultured Mediterranean phage uvMED]